MPSRYYSSALTGLNAHSNALKRASDLCLQLAAAAFSFEVAFVLFIFAGVYKPDARLAWVPVDLTLLFLVLSVGAAGWVLVGRGLRLSRRALLVSLGIVVFITWMVISLAWSASRLYGVDKAQQLGTLVLWAGIAPAFIIGPDPARFRRFISATLVFVSVMSIDGFISYIQGGGAVFSTENYLNLGRTVGFGTMIALVLFSVARSWWGRASLALLLSLFLFVLWIGGGRGPFLAAFVGVLVLVLGSFRWKGARLRVQMASSIAVLCVLGAIVGIWLGPESRTLHRLTILATQEAGGGSAGRRLEYYELTIEAVAKAPILGHGIGGWPIATGFGDVQRYPHNLFLETLTEGGAVGLALLFVAVTIALRILPVHRAFEETPRLIVFLLFVNVFASTQFSWDLSENRLLFTTLGLMAITTAPATISGFGANPVRTARSAR